MECGKCLAASPDLGDPVWGGFAVFPSKSEISPHKIATVSDTTVSPGLRNGIAALSRPQ